MHTHVLRFDLGLAFSQTILNIFILRASMVSKTFDQIIKRLLEPMHNTSLHLARSSK